MGVCPTIRCTTSQRIPLSLVPIEIPQEVGCNLTAHINSDINVCAPSCLPSPIWGGKPLQFINSNLVHGASQGLIGYTSVLQGSQVMKARTAINYCNDPARYSQLHVLHLSRHTHIQSEAKENCHRYTRSDRCGHDCFVKQRPLSFCVYLVPLVLLLGHFAVQDAHITAFSVP